MKKRNYIFVERENLLDDEKVIAKAILKYITTGLLFTAFMLLGLWCCSCKSPQESITGCDYSEPIEFDMNNVVGYDTYRNVMYYLLIDTIHSRRGDRIYHYVLEVDCSNVLLEELEQGASAYIYEGRLLYD
jgi:hypothetical protein